MYKTNLELICHTSILHSILHKVEFRIGCNWPIVAQTLVAKAFLGQLHQSGILTSHKKLDTAPKRDTYSHKHPIVHQDQDKIFRQLSTKYKYEIIQLTQRKSALSLHEKAPDFFFLNPVLSQVSTSNKIELFVIRFLNLLYNSSYARSNLVLTLFSYS